MRKKRNGKKQPEQALVVAKKSDQQVVLAAISVDRVLDQAEYLVRCAYRRTGGQGPEWVRLEWLVKQTIRETPIRAIWNAITSKEEEFFLLLKRVKEGTTP